MNPFDSKIAAKAVEILEKMQGDGYGRPLLPAEWQKHWRPGSPQIRVWIADLGLPQDQANALALLVDALIRFVTDTKGRSRHAGQLAEALDSYLDLRGRLPG